MADSIAAILADNGIRGMNSLRPGHSEHVICPVCNGGLRSEKSLSVSIDEDGCGVVWRCYRNKCDAPPGGARVGNNPRREEAPRSPRKPMPQADQDKPDWLYQFFFGRKIGAKTIEHFGIYAVDRNFPGLGQRPAIVFPYRLKGEVVNRKYRPHPDKTPQQQEKDALPTLFNVDALGREPDEIVWVEGEPDVMALHECGIKHAVSLKDGAPPKPTPAGKEHAESGKRYEALRTHEELLKKAKRIILATDTDNPGILLREELARRLGRHRCRIATWPDGCKDAGDTLREHGPDKVLEVLDNSTPYPIDGLHSIEPGTLLALRNLPPPQVLSTGTRETDSILKLPGEGRIITITGYPSHGKTSWTRFVMIHTAKEHDRRWAVFSPEHQPWEHFASQCAEVYCGKPFYPHAGLETMSDAEVRDAELWLARRMTMMVCDAEKDPPTIEWILEMAEATVLRDGTTDLLLDPWNEIDQLRGDMSETEYTAKTLQRLRAFALRYGCNVWIIAHPAKPLAAKSGESLPVPGPYSISGSQHFANKSDLGITVHNEKDVVGIYVWKSRFSRWGRRGTDAKIDFDQYSGRYRSPIYPQHDPEESTPHWTRD
jgi:twinkle protein